MFKYVVSARCLVSFKILWSSKRCLDDKYGCYKLFLPVLILIGLVSMHKIEFIPSLLTNFWLFSSNYRQLGPKTTRTRPLGPIKSRTKTTRPIFFRTARPKLRQLGTRIKRWRSRTLTLYFRKFTALASCLCRDIYESYNTISGLC